MKLIAAFLTTILLGTFVVQAVRADPQDQNPGPQASEAQVSDNPEMLPYKYVGNSFSLKFHRPSCPFAKAMHYSRISLFHFRREAITAGMKPCRYCLPPAWGTLKGTILPQQGEASTGAPAVQSDDQKQALP